MELLGLLLFSTVIYFVFLGIRYKETGIWKWKAWK